VRGLNTLLARLGLPGVLGIGLLLAAAGFYLSAVAPAEREIAEQRLASERLRARSPYQPVAAGGREEELQRFYALFPPIERLSAELDELYGLARASKLELAQGEYRLEKGVGLWSYRVTLPVRGSYSQIRAFVGAVLRDKPIASVDALRFERKKAGEPMLDAQLRLTVHFRPSGGYQ
jgi:hypothetical protein